MIKEYKGMKVGDLITTYYSGISELTHIEERYFDINDRQYYYTNAKPGREESFLFNFRQIYTSNFNPTRIKRIRSCSPDYCKKIDMDTINLIKSKILKLQNALYDISNRI